MSYNSCPLFGNPWAAWEQHSGRLDEIFERDRQRQKEYKESQVKRNNQTSNKAAQEK